MTTFIVLILLFYFFIMGHCNIAKFSAETLKSNVTGLWDSKVKSIGNLIVFSNNNSAISYMNSTDNLPYAAFFDSSGSVLSGFPIKANETGD